ncbi:LuxR C-terminal-related transcriptional regulator [Nocardia sp. NPDC057353]|uniref:LuxR C-terminal-related transcriptional regulator n=1 Tax=Nocardia sp. NPDC057353 TaxID=3346104 RepID=UPI003627314E
MTGDPAAALLDRLLGTAVLAAVVAPAGSGKTTAIRAWLAARDVRHRWMVPGCRAEAVLQPAGDVRHPAPEHGRRPVPSDAEVVVFDDCRAGEWSTEIGRAVARGQRVILAGRDAPPPAFWEALGRGRAVLVGFADLLLSRERVEQLARERGIEPAPELLDDLIEQTRGWAAPVTIALDAMAAGPVRVERLLLAAGQYLHAEVIADLSADQRARCARLALLDGFDDELAAEALRQAPLGEPDRRLLLPAAAAGEFEFPPILSRLLTRDDAAPTAEELTAIHLRAGRFHEARGAWDRALRHTLRAGPDRAVRQLKRMLAVLEPQGRSAEALRWFRLLPEAARTRPEALLGLGLALVQAGLPREAAQLLDQADPAAWEAADQVAELSMIRAMVHRLLVEHDAAVTAGEQALTLLDGAATAPNRRSLLRVLAVEQLREIACWRGDSARTRSLAADCHRDLLRAGHRLSLVHATGVTALAAAVSGDHARAGAQAAVALRTAEQCGFGGTHVDAEAHLVLGLIAAERGDLDRARTELRRARELAAAGMFPTTARWAELSLAPALAETGHLDEARLLLADLGDHARRTGDPVLAARLLVAAAQVHRHAGEPDAARAQYTRLAAAPAPPDVLRARILLACALDADRDFPALLPRLGTDPADAVLAALVRARLGDPARLADGLRRAERAELHRTPLELLRGHAHLLTDTVADLVTGPGPGYVRALAAELAESTPAAILLSARETQIALLLPGRKSQPSIAAELYISANTMKTHVKHIYQKLGVQTRDEAVARLVELGLVPG